MTGKDLLEKRLTLAFPQKEMADRMKVPLATYTRLEQNKDKKMPPRYEPAIELIESQRRVEFSEEELELMSAALRHSYEERIKTRNKTKAKSSKKIAVSTVVGKAATAPKKKSAAAKKI
jgi:transcriptional regulator with XRE-family HTH domain